MDLDYTLIENVSLADIHMDDYPDFCDAFIETADYNGREMTEEELEVLNSDRDYVYARVMDKFT